MFISIRLLTSLQQFLYFNEIFWTAIIFEHSVAVADAHPLAWRGDDKCGFASYAVYEIGPPVDIPCSVPARP